MDLEVSRWEERSPGDSLPVQATLETGARTLRLETQVTLPLDLFHMRHQFVLEGDDLFEFMVQEEGRPFQTGPYRLEAVIEGRPGAFSLDRVRLDTGESVIEGVGSLNTQAEIPVIKMRVSSERLALEDFLAPELRTKLEETLGEETASDPMLDLTQLREKLESFEATVDIDLEAVVLADELLGSAELSVGLSAGTLGITSNFSQATGGSATGDLQVNMNGGQIAGALLAETVSLDLGSIIERLELEGLDAGQLELDLEVNFDAATIEEVLASANGHLDATYYPEGADTRLLDLWAGPLFKVALPATGSEASRLNCIVLWFTIDDGLMTSDAFYLDTSRMRARGTGAIDLSTGKLDFKLSPRPKSRNFLNLATPVRVEGTWDDPSIRFTRGGLAGTLVKLYLWTLTVWRDLTRTPLPADGSDICLAPIPRTGTGTHLRP
jgi:hypothetical protein